MSDGTEVTYDFLVVAPGITLRFDLIEGAKEALADANCPVGSIYTLDGAYKTSVLRENFRGGRAIFTLPTMPIKCGGGPQKIMYLSEETFRKNGVRDKTEVMWHTTVGNLFPNCLKFAKALEPIAAAKGININYQSQLTAIDKDNRVATFKNLQNGDLTHLDFDFLHFAPPQTPHEFIRNSPLAHSSGWLDVNIHTLQHNKFPNVFGLGDVCNLPTAKTAAAVFSQSPVVANNILVQMGKASNIGKYDGYSSCPLFVGDGKLMLIEFKYGAEANESLFAD